jgi:hypothetical protein
VGDAEVNVVHHGLADAGEVFDEWDRVLFKGGFGADAGDHEELRGLEGACGQDDFFAGCDGVVFVARGRRSRCFLRTGSCGPWLACRL